MTRLTDYQARFNHYTNEHLPQDSNHIGQVFDAVQYSFSAGGKRLRPALVYALAESLDMPLAHVDAVAFAVECIHTYSLIHDDLPAMDDDDLRRGKPSCHKQFNEATAILAGDALNTLAFEILANETTSAPKQRLQQIRILAECAGVAGMVGGQDTDLVCEKNTNALTLAQLSDLHHRKTAKLIEACLLMSYFAAETPDKGKAALLSTAAQKLGLLYQIQDDILDVTESSETLGKPSGSDINNGKTTYVSLLGLEAAKEQAAQTIIDVEKNLTDFFAPQRRYVDTPLAEIVRYITQRNH